MLRAHNLQATQRFTCMCIHCTRFRNQLEALQAGIAENDCSCPTCCQPPLTLCTVLERCLKPGDNPPAQM